MLEEENTSKKNNKGVIKKTERRETISAQKSVINNALRLLDKRGIIIDAFVKKIFCLEI